MSLVSHRVEFSLFHSGWMTHVNRGSSCFRHFWKWLSSIIQLLRKWWQCFLFTCLSNHLSLFNTHLLNFFSFNQRFLFVIHFILLDVSCLLIVLTKRSNWPDKISKIKSHVNISVIPPDPILNVFLIYISTKVKSSEEDPQIICIDVSMSKLVNVSENLEHWKVAVTHKFLLQLFNLFDRKNFSFTNSDDSMFNVVAETY